jgi:hypothetical protein
MFYTENLSAKEVGLCDPRMVKMKYLVKGGLVFALEESAAFELAPAKSRTCHEAVMHLSRERDKRPSFAQERLWLLDQLEQDHALFCVPWGLRLQGRLNVAALAKSARDRATSRGVAYDIHPRPGRALSQKRCGSDQAV